MDRASLLAFTYSFRSRYARSLSRCAYRRMISVWCCWLAAMSFSAFNSALDVLAGTVLGRLRVTLGHHVR